MVAFEHDGLQRLRKGGQAGEIVMAVSLDALDAEGGLDGKVLQEGDGSDIGEILAAHQQGSSAILLAGENEAAVGNALENALAVLVAGPGVAEFKCAGQAVELGVGLINDDRAGDAVRPRRFQKRLAEAIAR